MSHLKSLSKSLLGPSLLFLGIAFIPAASADTYDGGRDTNNRFHGTGTYTYLSGGNYQGNWKHGQKAGQGKRTWSDGTVYEGDWKNNTAQGKGIKTFNDGSQYSGEFSNGERTQQGTMKWRNGDIYTGQWKKDKPDGTGTKEFANGATYTGQFASGKQSGEGKYTYPDKSHYNGNWKNNTPHGRGSLTFISGDKYTGNFIAGQPDGFGEFFYANGDKYTGQWKNGKRTGKGRLKYQAGGSYDGYFNQGKKSGYGILQSALGDEYAGPFTNDMAHGKGTCKNANKKGNCEYKFGRRTTSPGMKAIAAVKQKPATPAAPIASMAAVSTVIASVPIIAAKPTIKVKTATPKEAFKETIKADVDKLSKTYSLADIPQNTSNVLFSHDFSDDLMSLPEKAVWKKRSALFSEAILIESTHGSVRIAINLDSYRGPGVYTIDDTNVTVTHKGKGKYQPSEIKPSTIVIKSDDNHWISGTFDLALFSSEEETKRVHKIENGVFRLSKDTKTGYQNW